MRIFLFLILTMGILALPAFSLASNPFDAFVKSREVVETLYFKVNAEELSKTDRERLTSTAQKLRQIQNKGRMIRVEGFSSHEGDQEKNLILSFFRARSVADIIESMGLATEVTLTAYGDLRADSDDHAKERRVEIVSYVMPVKLKKNRVANKNKSAIPAPNRSANTVQMDPEIDSYRVDQAIRSKIGNLNKEVTDKIDSDDEKPSPGLSQEKPVEKDVLDRGYSQWRRSVDPGLSLKLSQSKDTVDGDLKRGYSQLQKSRDAEISPDLTQVSPAQSPVIDALMIEQAIMEKIGVEPTAASRSVTLVDLKKK
ncbi:OmpA family protein [Thermodesulfobacteriota bacterium]